MLFQQTWQLKTIASIRSCYKEKFGIPRQANLVSEAKAQLHFLPDYQQTGIVRALEDFSHLWLSFIFHETAEKGWHPTVRPPRLGGNQRVGVFASRSTFRPNPLGLSVVRLERVETQGAASILHLSGCDLLDGTPIVDIKPYLAYADAISNAQSAYAQEKPAYRVVRFSEQAQTECLLHEQRLTAMGESVNLSLLIEQILQQDPKPAYHKPPSKTVAKEATISPRRYAMRLFDLDIVWYDQATYLWVATLVLRQD
ncbi:MAG TPA: tRNA (N6-threonylcarbamoyladenosine(37)-N6)-methyltransferase TrmO, partial [Thiothrix sp.]|nr:tRNA (N6-threonylcarbamoyladenosine(37)-N6)-methyltransferase TrmO [Thiothrix sp.]